MKSILTLVMIAAVAVTLSPFGAAAQQTNSIDLVDAQSADAAESEPPTLANSFNITDDILFEPFQMRDEMFMRDDVVFLMRHGPTDWSELDIKDVAPDACANQRVMIQEGQDRMRDFATIMAMNDIIPSQIVTSQWCRNQQTVEFMLEGYARVDPQIASDMPVETDPELNLLLSLQGASDTSLLEQRITAWDGDPERSGPLLIVSHYTNIEELTQFSVFEGEILVLDPKRDNRVIGYVRLKSARPDVGHFADVLESTVLSEDQGRSMVERYYQALENATSEALLGILSDGWVAHGNSPSLPSRNAERFLEGVERLTDGLDDEQFAIEDVFVADDVVTVRATISGRHTGPLLGVEATGRDVAFGVIAVHRVFNGEITESWQMADLTTLMRLISTPE